VSTKAAACPHCGNPELTAPAGPVPKFTGLQKPLSKDRLARVPLLVVWMVLVVTTIGALYFWSTNRPEGLPKEATGGEGSAPGAQEPAKKPTPNLSPEEVRRKREQAAEERNARLAAANSKKKPKFSPAEVKNAETAIKGLWDSGFLKKLDLQMAEAYVDDSLWHLNTNVDQKRIVTFALARYREIKGRSQRMTILSYRDGRRLAKHDSWGFKIY